MDMRDHSPIGRNNVPDIKGGLDNTMMLDDMDVSHMSFYNDDEQNPFDDGKVN